MQDTVTTWDLRSLPHEPSSSEKLFAFFFLTVAIVGVVKLIKIWRGAPPFRLSRQTGNVSYVRQLETRARSLGHWMRLTVLICAFFACLDFYHGSEELVFSRKITEVDVIYLLLGPFHIFALGLSLIVWLFLIRWHLVKRLEHLAESVESRAL
jgi:hypothetical protein